MMPVSHRDRAQLHSSILTQPACPSSDTSCKDRGDFIPKRQPQGSVPTRGRLDGDDLQNLKEMSQIKQKVDHLPESLETSTRVAHGILRSLGGLRRMCLAWPCEPLPLRFGKGAHEIQFLDGCSPALPTPL